MTPEAGPKALGELMSRSRRILFFTGAGISTGSGIPDFRGPNGVWTKRRPVYYQDFLNSEDARVEHWDYKLEGFPAFKSARPNAAHLAIAALEKLGRLEAVVTQNIDGLHEAAGNSAEKIIELHGSNRWIECLLCARRYEPEPLFEEFRLSRRPPLCSCGGFLKTATVMFGQSMPQDKLARAFAAARQADLVVAAGSTLAVEPAASVPLARLKNVPYAIINLGATAHDLLATLRLEGDLTRILPEAAAFLRSRA
ncbi:MAG: Sir2 family NAD-dependent protein deacetylase [Elusimicrobia bacterium]|nr:Sir2 family NAD-dependent protein deacetylase [Elusimicrobiota bacterium]